MDVHTETSYEEEDGAGDRRTGQTLEEANNNHRSSLSGSQRSSLDSEAFDTDADEDPLSDKMDGGDAYRRRKAQLMAERENGYTDGRKGRQKRRHRQQGEENKHMLHVSDDGHASDFSSISTSDDVELDHLASDGILSDDEETGLTKKAKIHRKKRRKRETNLDTRIGGSSQASRLGQKIADRNVLKALALNSMLVVSWYIFSLSISI
ncbi:MAG: hypothetical protein Q9164_006504, partial [Protoblastenia rupestris]